MKRRFGLSSLLFDLRSTSSFHLPHLLQNASRLLAKRVAPPFLPPPSPLSSCRWCDHASSLSAGLTRRAMRRAQLALSPSNSISRLAVLSRSNNLSTRWVDVSSGRRFPHPIDLRSYTNIPHPVVLHCVYPPIDIYAHMPGPLPL